MNHVFKCLDSARPPVNATVPTQVGLSEAVEQRLEELTNKMVKSYCFSFVN